MKNVLYVGNALSRKGKTITTIEPLGAQLGEFFLVKIVSDKSSKIIRLLDMVWTLFSRRSNLDYVLIDTYSTTNFYYTVVISRMCRYFKIKYIPILHGGNLESRLKNSPKLSAKVFKGAYKLISPSNFMNYTFKKYGYRNIEFIPNTIKIENFVFQKKTIESIKLLWVRSFSEIYNPQLAVKVLKCLKVSFPNAELCMVGPDSDGSLSEVKKLSEELKLDVKFTGKLTKSEWIKLSEEYNIFINTTNYDNTPVSVIEAMALGLPVISTNVGGMPFLIEHNVDGILVDPNDVDNMVSEIKRLSQDEQLVKRLTCNARNKVEQFDWNVVKAKWKELLS